MQQADSDWLVQEAEDKKAQTDWLPLYLGLGGLVLVVLAFFLLKLNKQPEVQVEVISADETGAKIVVDLQGAVQNPGVYEMKSGDRLQDLLTKGGGLSANADRDWVSTNLNLALKLTDGQKVFIPAKAISSIENNQSSANQKGESSVLGAESEKVNINIATITQLDSLPGIGPARGQAIIDNRPYASVDELVTKKILTKSVFEKIRDQISVY